MGPDASCGFGTPSLQHPQLAAYLLGGSSDRSVARALLRQGDMATTPQALVHQLLASRLRVDESSIKDTDRFDNLGLGPLDIVLVVLQLDRLDRGDGEFPLLALEHATTVGDLVDLVELWLQCDTVRSPVARVSGF